MDILISLLVLFWIWKYLFQDKFVASEYPKPVEKIENQKIDDKEICRALLVVLLLSEEGMDKMEKYLNKGKYKPNLKEFLVSVAEKT